MQFQTHKAIARQGTAHFIFYMAVGTIGVVFTVAFMASAFFFARFGTEVGEKVAVTAAVLTFVGIAIASIAKGAQVRNGGGDYLAASLGGAPVNLHHPDHAERQLLNVTEEMALAAGMAIPRLFVLPDEQGINAFSAGWNPDNAVIGVTRGALYYLTRNELQAVVAREFSHIANGDMRVKTRTIAWVYGIGSIASFGKTVISTIRRNPTHPIVIVIGLIAGLALMAVGAVGGWVAQQMQIAVNREREHLADASAVEYTRNPDDLAGVLLKIGGLGPERNALTSSHVHETAHLFLVAPTPNAVLTHPPLRRRIALLAPSWDGTFPPVDVIEGKANSDIAVSVDGYPMPEVGIPTIGDLGNLGAEPVSNTFGASVLLGAFGATSTAEVRPPGGTHVRYARGLLNAIPETIRAELRTTHGAVASVLGLLASADPLVRELELERASELTGFPVEALSFGASRVSALDRRLHLPAIELALATIRSAPQDFRESICLSVDDLFAASHDTDLFRWMLRRVTRRHLHDAGRHRERQDNVALTSLAPQASVMYAVLAAYNSAGMDDVRPTFMAAHDRAGLDRPSDLPVPSEATLDHIESALDDLERMDAEGRRAFVDGALAAIERDSVTSAEEADLVRVIADSLGVPIPPLNPLY